MNKLKDLFTSKINDHLMVVKLMPEIQALKDFVAYKIKKNPPTKKDYYKYYIYKIPVNNLKELELLNKITKGTCENSDYSFNYVYVLGKSWLFANKFLEKYFLLEEVDLNKMDEIPAEVLLVEDDIYNELFDQNKKYYDLTIDDLTEYKPHIGDRFKYNKMAYNEKENEDCYEYCVVSNVITQTFKGIKYITGVEVYSTSTFANKLGNICCYNQEKEDFIPFMVKINKQYTKYDK